MDNIFQKKYWERTDLDKRRRPQHPVIEAFATSRINAIKNRINLEPTQELLDVGAGNGYFSYYFEKIINTTAVDYSEKMINLNPIKNKMVMDAMSLKFPDNKFDVVFESCMLHHVENIDQIISEMKRVSKKYLIIIEPNRNNPLSFLFGLIKKEERKSLKFSLNYLKNKLKKNGIKIISAFSFGAIAPNKTPKIILPFIKKIDVKIPLVGLDNIIICEKANEKNS